MDSTSNSDSDSVRLDCFETYFKKVFNSNGFMNMIAQRGNNDSTIYILLCEAIRRNDDLMIMDILHNCVRNGSSPDPNKDIPLQLAIISGHLELVKFLLNNGARANVSIQDGTEPLHLICDKKSTVILSDTRRIAIAKLLLKHGANINAIKETNGDTPLILAVESQFLELTKFLLKNGSNKYYLNKDYRTALHTAFAENVGIDMIELIYDDNFDLDQMDIYNNTLFYYAMKHLVTVGFNLSCSLSEPLKCIQFLIKNGVSVNSILDSSDHTILHMICQNHAVQTLKIFLDYGAEVNAKNIEGFTPLHLCAKYHPVIFINLLISYGADINVLTNDGQSVLHFAAENRHHEVLELFLTYNLDINAKCRGNFTPLFKAVWSNCEKNVQQLLNWHANVNERVINNQIVLHAAVDQKYVNMIDILLEHGSDINIVDDYDNTPLTISFSQYEKYMNSPGLNFEENENFEKIVKEMLTKHIAILVATNSYVSDHNRFIINHPDWLSFFENCIDELQIMKNTKLIENITFLNFLTMRKNKLLSYMRHERFFQAFSIIHTEKLFPIYQDKLVDNFNNTMERLHLYEQSEKTLIRIIQNVHKTWENVHFPSLVIEYILSYLNTTDLKNLSRVVTVQFTPPGP